MRAKWISLLFVLATAAFGQNLSTSGNITLQSSSCSGNGAKYVLYQLPPTSGNIGLTLSGTWSGTVQFVASVDGTNWSSINATPLAGGAEVTSAISNATWSIPSSGMAYICVYASTYTSGTIAVSMSTNTGGGPYFPSSGGPITGQVNLLGSTSTAVTDPGASYITVTPTCVTACSTTWVYAIVANNQFGESTNGALANAIATTAAQNATLSGSNFNTLTWTAKSGAYSYDIFRTTAQTSPATIGQIARVLASSPLTLVDNGLPAASPALDPNSNSIAIELTPTLLNDTAKTAYPAFIPIDTSINGVMIGTGPGNSIIYNGQSTRVGQHALQLNTTGTLNVAMGSEAMAANTTGSENTAVGSISMNVSTTGVYDTAIGSGAMTANTTGSYNTAVGTDSAIANQTGQHNTTIGVSAGAANTASNNTAVGYVALNADQFGVDETAVGDAALLNAKGNNNTGLGFLVGQTITSGSNNVLLGDQADVAVNSDTNEIAVGHATIGKGSNTTTIGNTSTVATYFYGTLVYLTLYSAAGTALPSCVTALKGAEAMVIDATSPTYHGTYTSGGAVVSPVYCNGSTWLTD